MYRNVRINLPEIITEMFSGRKGGTLLWAKGSPRMCRYRTPAGHPCSWEDSRGMPGLRTDFSLRERIFHRESPFFKMLPNFADVYQFLEASFSAVSKLILPRTEPEAKLFPIAERLASHPPPTLNNADSRPLRSSVRSPSLSIRPCPRSCQPRTGFGN